MRRSLAAAASLVLLGAAQATWARTAMDPPFFSLSLLAERGLPCCYCPCCGLLLILFIFMMFFGSLHRGRGISWWWLLLLPFLFRGFGSPAQRRNYHGGPFGGTGGGFGGATGGGGAGKRW